MLPVNRKTKVYCSQTIDRRADKDESPFLIADFEGNPRKVRYIGSSLNRELPVNRKTKVYCSQTMDRGADKDESLFLIVGTHCKCTTFLKASEDSKGMLRNY